MLITQYTLTFVVGLHYLLYGGPILSLCNDLSISDTAGSTAAIDVLESYDLA